MFIAVSQKVYPSELPRAYSGESGILLNQDGGDNSTDGTNDASTGDVGASGVSVGRSSRAGAGGTRGGA